tara:strand:- start:42 stop:737 length:696 start_codon:yes stop_codon:yes gene_type:complete
MKFDKFKNKHKGQRCFIIGCAPSLRDEDLSLLDGEEVFVCNKAFLASGNHNLPDYSYYVMSDPKVHADIVKYHREEFYSISKPRIYSQAIVKHKPGHIDLCEDFITIKKDYGIPLNHPKAKFPKSFDGGWGLTGTVVYEATITAYFMGFSEIYLLGVDMDFSNKDDTHFYSMGPREFNDRNTMERSWERIKASAVIIREGCESRGVKFVNLSKGFNNPEMIPVDTLENILK